MFLILIIWCKGWIFSRSEPIFVSVLRPIVSSIGAVNYETAKELAKILKPLVGKSIYHVHNTQDFI